MSPQLQKLIDQCLDTSTSYFDGRGNITITSFDREKFAKLIVWEVINTAEHIEGIPNILKHFGVKE